MEKCKKVENRERKELIFLPTSCYNFLQLGAMLLGYFGGPRESNQSEATNSNPACAETKHCFHISLLIERLGADLARNQIVSSSSPAPRNLEEDHNCCNTSNDRAGQREVTQRELQQ